MLLVLAALPSYGVLVLLALSTGICILAFFLLHAQQKRIPPLSVQPSKTAVDTLLRLCLKATWVLMRKPISLR